MVVRLTHKTRIELQVRLGRLAQNHMRKDKPNDYKYSGCHDDCGNGHEIHNVHRD